MKKLILLFCPFLAATSLYSQAPYPSVEEGKLLTASTTCVVLENNPFSEFNPAIRDAVKAYWTLTPYEFIDINEFNTRRQNPAYSFLVLTETEYEKDKSGSTFSFINLLLGKKVRNLEELPEFCAIPLDFAGDDADAWYAYKMGMIIRFIQSHAQLVIANPKNQGVRYLRYYNQFVPEIMDKTVLAREEDMEASLAGQEAVAGAYSGKFLLVSDDEIRSAVDEKRPNTLILHKVGPPDELTGAYVFKMLIGTDDAKMYYFNTHKIDARNPNGFLPSDLRRLARF
ncbi:MAG: hypothetical protein FJY11_01645 [Bacteroidetes bacterium]|nr:hypothetical protein [Bacteroidota bacterium]